MRTHVLRTGIAWIVTCAVMGGPGGAFAMESTPRFAVSTLPAAASTTSRLQTRLSIDVKNHRLEDVLAFIADSSGIEIEAMWLSDRHGIGMDKEALITLKASDLSLSTLIERVLAAAASDTTGAYGMTWQLTDSDSLQIGPRERLNAFRRVEIYDINDLLSLTPDFTNAPQFDLNSVLQSSSGRGGGGSSQSPFTPANRGTSNQPGTGVNGQPELTKQQRAEELRAIITQLVEPEQWEESGSSAASIRFYQNAFIVNAPDYIHRALAGDGRGVQQHAQAASR